ncbi:MAG: flagellar motor switch protein FliG [Terriglobia bacterium]
MAETATKMTGARKAAILMVLMGEKAASSVLRHLPQKQVERLMREVAKLGALDPAVSKEVLREFTLMERTGSGCAAGNSAYAEKLLVEAFGEPAAKHLLERATRPSDTDPADPKALEKADPSQLAKVLENEGPQTIALVIAHMDAGLGPQLLNLLPEKLRVQVVERMARMRTFSPEVVERTMVTLRKKMSSMSTHQQVSFGGVNAVAKLLKSLDATSSKTILESIGSSNPDLVSDIRGLMFTFEDLREVTEAGIRELIAQADKKALSLALKGATPELQAHFFKCMSSRAVEMLKEDMEALGPVRMRDAVQAQQELTILAQKLEEEGKLMRRSADGSDSIL